MKTLTLEEQIKEVLNRLDALENNLVCGDGQCGCGCDESPVETEDEGPEFDSAGFSEADRVISGQYMNVGAETVVFTREELITFAAKLMERTVQACKEAVSDTDFEPDYICSLSLNYNNQIEVEIDNGVIRDAVENEIDNIIELDNDSVEVEVDNILRDMLKQS